MKVARDDNSSTNLYNSTLRRIDLALKNSGGVLASAVFWVRAE